MMKFAEEWLEAMYQEHVKQCNNYGARPCNRDEYIGEFKEDVYFEAKQRGIFDDS